MWKLRMCIVGSIGVFALATGGVAIASSNGNSNAGDVWLDSASASPGPGHEMDPHLPCGPINLYGSGLADSGGNFTIDSWPPSGQQQAVYTDSWSYNTTTEGTQKIAQTIDGNALVQAAVNAGATASNQGYHFKLDFSQDPQKHKTFWVNCPPPSSSSSSQTAAAPSNGSTTTSSTSPSGASQSTTAPATAGSTPSAPAATPGTKSAVKGAHATRRRHRAVKARKLVRPKRHTAPRKRSVKAASTAAPAFTG
jgi:hypothetical protein